MTLVNKLAIVLVLLAASFAGGLYYGRGQKEVITVEGKTVTKEVEKIVTVTKIVKPDGTVEETVKTEEKEKNIKDKNTSSATKSVLAQWGVGGGLRAEFGDLTKQEAYGTVSRRILGPAWVELQGSKSAASVGIRVEF